MCDTNKCECQKNTKNLTKELLNEIKKDFFKKYNKVIDGIGEKLKKLKKQPVKTESLKSGEKEVETHPEHHDNRGCA